MRNKKVKTQKLNGLTKAQRRKIAERQIAALAILHAYFKSRKQYGQG